MEQQRGIRWLYNSCYAAGGVAVYYPSLFRLYAHQPWYSLEYQDVIKADSVNLYGNSFTDMHFAKHVTGQRQYEVTDHLGNVLATVSDKRAGLTFGPPPDPLAGTGGGYTGGGAGTLTGVFAPGDLVEISTWKPIIISLHDYYPFGEYMPGRYRSDTSANCVTTTINEVYPDVGNINIPVADLVPTMTTFNGPILNTIGGGAALQMNGPGPFAFSSLPASISNSGLYIPTGTDHVNININAITGQHTFQLTDDATGMVIGSTTDPGTSAIAVVTINIATTPHSNTFTYTILDDFNTGSVEYTGITIPYDTISAHNVVTTVCNTDFYRYGFNGQQKVNEIAGVGNHNSALFWEYDTRTGRRWNLDPVPHAWESPYATFGGNPIWRSDVLGNEFTNGNTKKKEEAKTKLDAAQKNYDEHKGDKDISKRELKKLQHAVDDAKSDYNTQVEYEKVANNVIDEFKNKNPKEFEKWNHFIQDGKEVDIPVTIQADPIDMYGADGKKIGTTTEGTTYGVYKLGRPVVSAKSQLVAPHFATGQSAVIILTSDMVHGLGHIQVYIKEGKTGENETENQANQYEHDVYNHGKGPKK